MNIQVLYLSNQHIEYPEEEEKEKIRAWCQNIGLLSEAGMC